MLSSPPSVAHLTHERLGESDEFPEQDGVTGEVRPHDAQFGQHVASQLLPRVRLRDARQLAARDATLHQSATQSTEPEAKS